MLRLPSSALPEGPPSILSVTVDPLRMLPKASLATTEIAGLMVLPATRLVGGCCTNARLARAPGIILKLVDLKLARLSVASAAASVYVPAVSRARLEKV